MPRISTDEYYLQGAEWAATRGTCLRRQVGCILVNRRGHVIAGPCYNGVESGALHCNEEEWEYYDDRKRDVVIKHPHACKGAFLPSGQGLDQCDAIHAEQNALLQCRNVFEIVTCYVTHSPCIHCVKLLMGTSCERIVFRHRYAHDEAASLKWLNSKYNAQNVHREWIHVPGGPNDT